MSSDVVFETGSMLGKAISLATGLVAAAAGMITLFDTLRASANRETKAKDCVVDSATDVSLTVLELAATSSKREGNYAYTQAHLFGT